MLEIKPEGSWTLIGMAGGAARAINVWLAADDGSPVPWRRIFFNSVQAGFFGFSAGLFTKAMGYSEIFALCAASAGGYMGVEIAKVIFNAWKKRQENRP